MLRNQPTNQPTNQTNKQTLLFLCLSPPPPSLSLSLSLSLSVSLCLSVGQASKKTTKRSKNRVRTQSTCVRCLICPILVSIQPRPPTCVGVDSEKKVLVHNRYSDIMLTRTWNLKLTFLSNVKQDQFNTCIIR